MSGLDEMCLMRWSPPTSSPEASSWKTVSEGECPGRWCTRQARPANSSSASSASGVSTLQLAPQARNERVTARSAMTMSGGMPWRSMIASAKASSASMTSE